MRQNIFLLLPSFFLYIWRKGWASHLHMWNNAEDWLVYLYLHVATWYMQSLSGFWTILADISCYRMIFYHNLFEVNISTRMPFLNWVQFWFRNNILLTLNWRLNSSESVCYQTSNRKFIDKYCSSQNMSAHKLTIFTSMLIIIIIIFNNNDIKIITVALHHAKINDWSWTGSIINFCVYLCSLSNSFSRL